MGGELDHLTNLTIRGLNREVPQIFFTPWRITKVGAWHCRIFRSHPLRRDRWKESSTASKLRRIVWPMWSRRRRAEAKIARRWTDELRCILVRSKNRFLSSIRTATRSNCPMRRDPMSDKPQGKVVPMRRISHVRMEVTDMAQGKSWYCDTFGLTKETQVPGR